MTIGIFKNKYFIIAMCIFIVIAAWSTVVFLAADNTDGTHFFAVHFMEFIKPYKPHTISEKHTPQFVAWIQRTSYITENISEYLANNTAISSGIFSAYVPLLGQALKNTFFHMGKTTFYLRI